jgi:GNAT superfamily N-acetyltransferase
MEVKFRRYRDDDAERISEIVRRNFMEVNIKDYDEESMESLCAIYDADKVRQVTSYANMYVAYTDDEIIGTGAISSFWGSLDESILLTIFVIPELQGHSIGRKIMETLEQDELFTRARRIEIPSSITAAEFYKKFGYDHKDGIKELDDEGHYRLEKFRQN